MHTPGPMLSYVRELAQENRKLSVEREGLQAKLNQNFANSNKPPPSEALHSPADEAQKS